MRFMISRSLDATAPPPLRYFIVVFLMVDAGFLVPLFGGALARVSILILLNYVIPTKQAVAE